MDLDKNSTPVNIFLDLSKAFETLDHDILLSKLEYYGVDGTSLKLMENYITNRKQYVNFDDTDFEILHYQKCVHNYILRPLLFIIYINDIHLASNLFHFIIYADDTTLQTTLEIVLRETQYIPIDTKLNHELSKVSDWLKLNKLSLNVQKSKYIVFHKSQKVIHPLHLTIDGSIIDRVSDFNFLGLNVDENLNWKSHINKISNKISRTVGILNKLKYLIPLKY